MQLAQTKATDREQGLTEPCKYLERWDNEPITYKPLNNQRINGKLIYRTPEVAYKQQGEKMENINYELIGAIFISIMAVRFAWDFMLWVEKWIDKFSKIFNK